MDLKAFAFVFELFGPLFFFAAVKIRNLKKSIRNYDYYLALSYFV